MLVNNIVINASPLILLWNTELAFILPEMFANIVVPEAVWQEIVRAPYVDKASQMLPETDWIKQVSVTNVEEIIRWDLGDGETAVLSFVFSQRMYTPVLDDLAAKRCAMSLGIQTLGTGSILILAKERGLIDSVEQSLRKLQHAGLWISEPIITLLKTQAGE